MAQAAQTLCEDLGFQGSANFPGHWRVSPQHEPARKTEAEKARGAPCIVNAPVDNSDCQRVH
ncbi:hypothetical protein GCM10010390_92900 [Streptomyces mordarskii]|uniref:Uncharacterized protein n=1 Tax=Streptomyces mordarskii TaxID=1226758 RepID=A0ABN1EWD0_9ACTN